MCAVSQLHCRKDKKQNPHSRRFVRWLNSLLYDWVEELNPRRDEKRL